MRPYANSQPAALFAASLDHGLPHGGNLVYNQRQNLPVRPDDAIGTDALPSTSETLMKRPRPIQDRSSSTAESVPPVETRAERLARIRKEIAAGTYETPEKLEAAIERMLGVLVD